MSKRMIKDIARQRILILLQQADREVRRDEQLAKRYVELAVKIASKARIRIPRKVRRKYCRKCYVPLIPGRTARIRVKKGRGGTRIVIACLRCGNIRRYPVTKRSRAHDPSSHRAGRIGVVE